MKVSIIGPGRVGSAIGLILVARGLVDEIVLVGRRLAYAQGEAADLEHAGAFVRPTVVRGGTIDDTAGSDIIVVALSTMPADAVAGRHAAAASNAAGFRELFPPLSQASPDSVLLIASNPVDALTTLAGQLSGFPHGRVLGTGTLLDTMRLRVRLSEVCRIHPNDLRAYVLGEHGDSQFVAAASANTGGSPLPVSAEALRAIETEVRHAGHRIVERKGFTNHGIALAVAEIIEAIVTDRRAVLPLSIHANGFAGVDDVCLSLPVVVGREGAARTLPVPLTPTELDAFRRSAQIVRATLATITAG